jgi:hypothetical protein
MAVRAHPILRLALPALLAMAALTFAGCTSTVDPAAAEHAITVNMHKFGPLQVKSVSCPSGVKQRQGASFSCTLTLHNTANGTTGAGTITIHVANGGHALHFGANDVHVH